MMRRRNLGFSLLEIAIVMSIAGLIVAGIWMAASEANHQSNKQALERGTIQIINNVEAYFSNQSANIGSFTRADALAADLFPASWVQGTGATAIIHHPFATDLSASTVNLYSSTIRNNITLALGNATANVITNSRTVARAGIPADACVDLVQKLGNPTVFSQLSLTGIVVTGKKGRGSKFTAESLPFDVNTITTACSEPDNNAISIVFDIN